MVGLGGKEKNRRKGRRKKAGGRENEKERDRCIINITKILSSVEH